MSRDRANLLCYLFIVATVAAAAWLYPDLPDPMPSHWNVDGEVDGWIAKPWGVAILPGSAILAFVVFRLIPRRPPAVDVLNVLQVASVAFACFVALLVLFTAKGVDVRINQMIFGGIGILFIVLGNYIGRLGSNFFVGVRTPWTVASDEVWARTHRIARWVFILMGLVFLAGAFGWIGAGWAVGANLMLALVPMACCRVIYRRASADKGRAS